MNLACWLCTGRQKCVIWDAWPNLLRCLFIWLLGMQELVAYLFQAYQGKIQFLKVIAYFCNCFTHRRQNLMLHFYIFVKHVIWMIWTLEKDNYWIWLLTTSLLNNWQHDTLTTTPPHPLTFGTAAAEGPACLQLWLYQSQIKPHPLRGGVCVSV